jgi:murein DD-endopeptidase MepM/ murein hydrolase activator NlpD
VPRRLFPLLVLALFVAAAPAAGDVGSRKADVDAKIARLHDRIAAARARESQLTREIAEVTTRIRGLERRVGDVSSRLAVLEDDLALHERRLRALEALYRVQTRRFEFLRDEYAAALHRLDTRLVEIYKEDQPSTVEIVLASRSFQELLDQIDYLNAIASQDERIAAEVGAAKREVRIARAQTRKVKVHVAAETQVIQVRADQVAAVRDRLLASEHKLSDARSRRRGALAVTQESEQEYLHEVESLAKVSAQLGAQIQAAQRSSSYTPAPASPGDTSPSVHGLIWPASGPVTSPFGYRWGRLHEGIDIGAPYGAPIVAAAAGRVIYCGWLGGYGNLTVIDHGGGLATAYGHQSSIVVACGQEVSQGQVIGYVGSTGHSTGPHLHFEVRVNGTAVDPLGYL